MFLLFLIPHMGGNVLFLFGPDLFNSYAHHLHKLIPIVIGIEVLMLVSISVHMIMAARTMGESKGSLYSSFTKRIKRALFGGASHAVVRHHDFCVYRHSFGEF